MQTSKDSASNSSTIIYIPDASRGFWARCPYCDVKSDIDWKQIVWAYTVDMCTCVMGRKTIHNGKYTGMLIAGESVTYMPAMVMCSGCDAIAYFREVIEVSCACGESYRWLFPHLRQRGQKGHAVTLETGRF